MKEALLRAGDRLYSLCIWTAGLSVAAIALIIPLGIFTRYVLGSGSYWPEPVAVLLMVLFTFIGAAASYRAWAHMAVEMLTKRMPPALRHYASVVVQLLMALISLFMLLWGTSLCMETWEQFSSSLPGLRVGLTYAPIPLGGLITLIFVVERALFGDQSRRAVVRLDHEDIDCEEAL
ncbi:TRAP transporter small permease [Azotobacter armeniacus]